MLWRDGGVERCESLVGRTLTERRHLVCAVLDARLRQEHGTGLEDREVGQPARDVAVRGQQQTRDERSPQKRCLSVERVRQADARQVLARGRAVEVVLRRGRERE
jgi:hypothetical protein